MRIINLFNINLRLMKISDLIEIVLNSLQFNSRCNIIACDFRDLLYFSKNENYLGDDFILYPDSSGAYYSLRIFYRSLIKGFKKLVSTDFHYLVLEKCIEKELKIFAYGDTKQTVNKFKTMVNSKKANIVVGTLDGFSEQAEDQKVLLINNSGADLLLIGLGIPRQFEFLKMNSDRITVPVAITVGAFFTFYTGKIDRAPQFIRMVNLEWFYRFLKEPKRLFARYFVQFPKFLIIMLKERIKSG